MKVNDLDMLTFMPKVTIITVVYNAASKIEETILSVIRQTYENIEYIIIDGGSCDGTVEIIKKYSDKINFWSSSRDSGIYNAMNKGIDVATGSWINFMNAGDKYFNTNVISSIFEDEKNHSFDVLYGNSILERSDKTQIKQPVLKPQTELWKAPVFRHGTMFTKTAIHKKYPFNENINYKICADFDFIYKIHTMNFTFKFVDLYILIFEEEGISNNLFKNSIYNRMVVLSYTNELKYNIWHLVNILRCFGILCKQKMFNHNSN